MKHIPSRDLLLSYQRVNNQNINRTPNKDLIAKSITNVINIQYTYSIFSLRCQAAYQSSSNPQISDEYLLIGTLLYVHKIIYCRTYGKRGISHGFAYMLLYEVSFYVND